MRTGPSTEGTQPTISRRILIIDHDDGVRRALVEQLSALGCVAIEEGTGIAGLARLTSDTATAPFHGVLVELQMPVLDGLAVLQEIKDRFPSMPVIAMSDAQNVSKLRQAVKLGAEEYVMKPFDTELFRRKCTRVFLDGR